MGHEFGHLRDVLAPKQEAFVKTLHDLMVFNVLGRFNEIVTNELLDVENKGLVLLSAVEYVSIDLTEVFFELLK